MPFTTPITPAQAGAVTALLRPNLGFLIEGPNLAPSVALRESFRIYNATTPALLEAVAAKVTLASACHDSSIWHHQLAVEGEVTAFGETTFANDPESGEFVSLMKGALARDLDQAVQIADEKFDDTFNAKLVRIRAVSLYFLLLAREAEEYVVIAYSLFKRLGLGPSEVLNVEQFASGLRRLPPGGGVAFR
jgi:hypothetical protein